jgi:hypothetical protein
MRFIALDVHRDFCEVAIAEGGQVRRAGRVETSPATLELFARSLAADDQLVLEATGNALAIARIIEPHVGRVVLANPKAVKNATQTAKTDKLDACAGEAARGRLSPGGLDAGRAHARPASTAYAVTLDTPPWPHDQPHPGPLHFRVREGSRVRAR